MAGFQVTLRGRIWVTAEGTTKDQLGAVLKAPHFQFTARFKLTYA